MAGRTESANFTEESQQSFRSTVTTADSRKPTLRIATAETKIHKTGQKREEYRKGSISPGQNIQ